METNPLVIYETPEARKDLAVFKAAGFVEHGDQLYHPQHYRPASEFEYKRWIDTGKSLAFGTTSLFENVYIILSVEAKTHQDDW